jgi:putative membrane protein
MKNVYFLFAATAMLAIQSCGGKSNRDAKAVADSTNTSLDSIHSKTNPTTGRTLSGPDAKFAVAAYNGGLAEVNLGRLARQKAVNQQVKDFGAMMVEDHSKANAELKTIAEHHFVTLPDSAGAAEQQLMRELSAKSGSDFDKAYVEAMVKDHEEDIKSFNAAQATLTYDDLRAFNKKTLPVLQKHLDAIKSIQSQLKQ